MPRSNPDPHIKKLLEQARIYYRQGLQLLREHPHKACESVWGAVDAATRALNLRIQGRPDPPDEITWRKFMIDTFTKAGLDPKDAEIWARFYVDAAMSGLHGECFYGMRYDKKRHDESIRDAGKYIRMIRRLVRAGSPPIHR